MVIFFHLAIKMFWISLKGEYYKSLCISFERNVILRDIIKIASGKKLFFGFLYLFSLPNTYVYSQIWSLLFQQTPGDFRGGREEMSAGVLKIAVVDNDDMKKSYAHHGLYIIARIWKASPRKNLRLETAGPGPDKMVM